MTEALAEHSGPERVAILLLSLGEEYASAVLQHFTPKEVQKVGAAMAALGHVTRQQMDSVVTAFTESVKDETNLGVGTDGYLRRVLVGALGEQRATGLLDQILEGGSSNGIDALKWMDARSVAEVIRLEHPQIVATVLSRLEADHAAAVLACLPQNAVADVIMRVATLESIQPGALRELDDMLEKQFAGRESMKASASGGIKVAAGIMNFLDAGLETQVLAEIERAEPELGTSIADSMFIFDNLIDLDGRSIQQLLREVQTDQLIVALKGADSALKDKFLANMSKRAAEGLREEMETRGPVRVSEVEGAQKEIVSIARRMADEGEIDLGGGGGDEYV